MQDDNARGKVKRMIPKIEDSMLDRMLERIWALFEKNSIRDHQANRLLVLADIIFRDELPDQYSSRIPQLSADALRELKVGFDIKSTPLSAYYGIFSRLFDRSAPTFVNDPSTTSLDEAVSLVAYREMIIAYLALVVVNDSFPCDSQLSKQELLLIRDAFLGQRSLTNQIAGTVERKFQVSLFKQANLLLHLYKSKDKGWARQEQKLFYEEFILNFGVHRRYLLDESLEVTIKQSLTSAESQSDILAAFKKMEDIGGIQMVGYFKTSSLFPRFLATTLQSKANDMPHFSDFFPNRRWRTVATRVGDAGCLMREHISPESLRLYLLRQLCACFVILRAHGNTGFEDFVETLLAWLEETFKIKFETYLPTIYWRSMMLSEPIEDVFDEIYSKEIGPVAEKKLSEIRTEDISIATIKAIHKMGAMALKGIAPGNYDFGAFVYDSLFGLAYPVLEYPFLIHRLN